MYLFVIPFLVGAFVQAIKLCIDFFTTKKFAWRLLRSSGGFPSVHSALSSSVTTVIALHEGIGSSLFALAIGFSFLFWYDAMNVRFESGKHASYINKLRNELQGVLSEHQTSLLQLKERIGHTPTEVLGGIVVGVITTVLLYFWSYQGLLLP